MELLQWIGISLLALIMLVLLRQYNPSYAVVASLAAGAVLLFLVLQSIAPLFALAQCFAESAGTADFSCLIKAVLIAVLTQFTADLCREAGQLALAGRVEFTGKIAVLASALPLFQSLGQILVELLQ